MRYWILYYNSQLAVTTCPTVSFVYIYPAVNFLPCSSPSLNFVSSTHSQ